MPLAYAPPAGMPEVAPLPALANGFITFGHFGRTQFAACFTASPLGDAPGLARAIETVYRHYWDAWRSRLTAATPDHH